MNKSFVQRVDASRVDISLSGGGFRTFDGDWSVLEVSESDRFLSLYLPQFEAHTFGLFDRGNNLLRELDGYPVLSQGENWVAEANTDLDAGWSPNVLKIYRVTTMSLDLVFSAEPERWGPEEVTWQSSRELTYVRATVDCYHLQSEECVSAAVTFDGNEWH